MRKIVAISETYHCRPSEILGIEGLATAYDFDIATLYYSNCLKDDMTPNSEADDVDIVGVLSGNSFSN